MDEEPYNSTIKDNPTKNGRDISPEGSKGHFRTAEVLTEADQGEAASTILRERPAEPQQEAQGRRGHAKVGCGGTASGRQQRAEQPGLVRPMERSKSSPGDLADAPGHWHSIWEASECRESLSRPTHRRTRASAAAGCVWPKGQLRRAPGKGHRAPAPGLCQAWLAAGTGLSLSEGAWLGLHTERQGSARQHTLTWVCHSSSAQITQSTDVTQGAPRTRCQCSSPGATAPPGAAGHPMSRGRSREAAWAVASSLGSRTGRLLPPAVSDTARAQPQGGALAGRPGVCAPEVPQPCPERPTGDRQPNVRVLCGLREAQEQPPLASSLLAAVWPVSGTAGCACGPWASGLRVFPEGTDPAPRPGSQGAPGPQQWPSCTLESLGHASVCEGICKTLATRKAEPLILILLASDDLAHGAIGFQMVLLFPDVCKVLHRQLC